MPWPKGRPRQVKGERITQYEWRLRKWDKEHPDGPTSRVAGTKKWAKKTKNPGGVKTFFAKPDGIFKKHSSKTVVKKNANMKNVRKQLDVRVAPKSIHDHANMLKPMFNKVDVEARSIPIPKTPQEPLPVRMQPTLTDAQDGGLMQDIVKEARRKGIIGEGEVNPGIPGVRVCLNDITIEGPAEQMIAFCKELNVLEMARE